MAKVACPTVHQLQRLMLGLLPEPETAQLGEHLLACSYCGNQVAALQTEDSLVALLQSQPQADESLPYHQEIESLIAQLTSVPVPLSAQLTATWFPGQGGQQPGPVPTPRLGSLGTYRLLRVLGQGGMGVVFEAEDTQLGRRVAVKTLRPVLSGNLAARDLFLREARAIATLEHPHIVPIFHVSAGEEVPYFVMPLLRGESLAARLRRARPFPVPELLRIGRQIAEGLAAAHAVGIIHRDIKPANIWLEPPLESSGPRTDSSPSGSVKLLDFGLAGATWGATPGAEEGKAGSGVVFACLVVGTPAYMAPEQARGAESDGRADLYSLGCVLYLLATGQSVEDPRPSEQGSVKAALSVAVPNVLDLPPERSPCRLNPRLPAALGELILQLLATEPSGRPASAAAVAETLQQIEATLATPPSRVRLWRRPLVLGFGLTALVLLLGSVLAYFTPPTLPPEPKPGSMTLTPTVPRSTAKSTTPVSIPLIRDHRLFQGHRDIVWCVAFSPDGQWALSGSGHRMLPGGAWQLSDDYTVRLWNVTTGQQEHSFPANASDPKACEHVVAVSFTADGDEIVAVSKRMLLRWDRQSKAVRVGFPQRMTGQVIFTAAIMADGRRALTNASARQQVILWDLETGQALRQWQAHDEVVQSLAFSPDGQRALVAGGGNIHTGGKLLQGRDYSVRLWDLAPGQEKELQRLTTVRGFIWGLAFSPQGARALTAGVTGRVWLWDARTGKELRRVMADSSIVMAVAFSPDGRWFLAGGTDGVIRLFETETGRECCRFEKHTGMVRSLAWAPDGRHFLSGGIDGTVRLWRVPPQGGDV